MPQAQFHSRMFKLLGEIPNGLFKLFLPWDPLGQKKLPPKFGLRFKQHHLRTQSGPFQSRTHSSWPSANDSDCLANQFSRGTTGAGRALLLGLGAMQLRKLVFMTSTGVDEARGDLLFKDMVQTSLIATDARVDVFGTSKPRFADEERIGQERSRHADHI